MRPYAGAEAEAVLVISPVSAPLRWRGPEGGGKRRRFKARSIEPPEQPVAIDAHRATVIWTQRGGDEAELAAWLEQVRADGDAAATEVRDALRVVNRALRAHRAAAADPYARELGPGSATTTRLGYGDGEQVADARWTAAVQVDLAEEVVRGRSAVLRPAERLGAVLGGRDLVLACEELALRARLDLDQGHLREAALELHLALEAALSELPAYAELPGVTERLAALEDEREDAAAVANEALAGGLDPGAEAGIAEALRLLESVLRARDAAAAY